MAIWAPLILLSGLAFIASVFLIFFRRFRRRALVGLVASLGLMIFSGSQITGIANQEAAAEGWASAQDRRVAEEAGFNDPTAWRAHREAEAAELAEAERLRQEAADREAEERAEADRRRQEERAALLAPPAAQVAIAEAVRLGRERYEAAGNEMQQGATRPERARAICAALGNNRVANNWVGKLSTLSTNSDGWAVVSIDTEQGFTASTWNNSLSDVRDRTLVPPETGLYRRLLELQTGDMVRFSGQLFSHQADCVREKSLTMRGSMRAPDFLIRLESVVKIDLPE